MTTRCYVVSYLVAVPVLGPESRMTRLIKINPWRFKTLHLTNVKRMA